MKTIGYATHSKDSQLEPFNFERRNLRSNDVAIEILYSGICHSDLHQARNDWGWHEQYDIEYQAQLNHHESAQNRSVFLREG